MFVKDKGGFISSIPVTGPEPHCGVFFRRLSSDPFHTFGRGDCVSRRMTLAPPISTDDFGALRVTRGSQCASGAPIAVVIIAYEADPRTAKALRSVLTQGAPVEVIVVNSGSASLEGRLGTEEAAVTLIETSSRQFVGGARNLGVLFSRAPIVAFLAADCLAGPGWLRRRLAAHERGHDLVASALLPAPGPTGRVSRVAWASCILTHTGRMPETPPEVAARYGLSYRRSLFGKHGLFDAGLRIGEDTDFNRRCANAGRPEWDPRIVTFHDYPHDLLPAAAEQFRRGRMAAFYAREMLGRSPVMHVLHAVYRGLVVNERLAHGRCSPPAKRLAVRMLVMLLFGFNLLGVLSACFATRRSRVRKRATGLASAAPRDLGMVTQPSCGSRTRIATEEMPELAQFLTQSRCR